ncbi:MAG: hypothetical protein GY820_08430 [Gammaproteobacteria bacterium]|nr:hypothetical protein [Gammaproteobacteria bacterium]
MLKTTDGRVLAQRFAFSKIALLDEAAKAAEGPIIVLSGKHTNVGVFITVERR